MSENLPSEVREANAVDVTPWVRSDPGIIFRQGGPTPTYQTILQFPNGPSDGSARVWGGPGCSLVAEHQIANGPCRFGLKRGLYLAEVPTDGLRQGFEITGGGDAQAGAVTIEVIEKGPPVTPPAPSAEYQLSAKADNPAAAITVVDNDFNRVPSWGTGELGVMTKAGLYKIRVQYGREIAAMTERIVLLDRPLRVDLVAPPIASPAPIPGSAMLHEFQEGAYHYSVTRKALSEARTAEGLDAQPSAWISIIGRYWTGRSRRNSALRFPHPLDGLQVLASDETTITADLTADAEGMTDHPDYDPVSTWSLKVRPGVYFVRQNLADGRAVVFALTACAGWITQLAIRRATTDATIGAAPDALAPRIRVLGDPAVLMRMPDAANPVEDRMLEAARIALAEGRNILGEGRGGFLRQLLNNKFVNPILGILGAHLLIMAADQEPGSAPQRLGILDQVVENLRGLVGGRNHPDVEALSLRCPNESLRARVPFLSPPLFKRSWQLMVEASYENAELVPQQLWEQVRATTPAGAYLVWACDERSREAHKRQLKDWSAAVAGLGLLEAGSGTESETMSPAQRAMAGVLAGWTRPALEREIRENARRIDLPAGALADIFSTVASDVSSGGERGQA
jgi:hypothetical protein